VGKNKLKSGGREMVDLMISMMMAVTVVIVGLYSVVFGRSAANWVLKLDNNLVRTDLHEKVYRTGFTVVGALFIAFGILTVLLIA
jgi:hypothetical protein